MKKTLTIIALSLGLGLSSHMAEAASKGKVLVLLSSESQLPLKDGKTHTTGYFLNEFGVPADALLKAGYEVDVVTPKGNTAVVDKDSVRPQYFGGSQAEMTRIQNVINNLPSMKHSLSLKQVLASDMGQYKALFIPGGHAPIIDLANNPDVGRLLSYFHHAHKTTAAICHGPISLLAAQDNPKGFEQEMANGDTQPVSKHWIYQGYNMTIFSTPEEEAFESSLKGEKMRYIPARAMEAAGGNMTYAGMWKSHVVVDRELITGQNPFSDEELAKTLVNTLNSQK